MFRSRFVGYFVGTSLLLSSLFAPLSAAPPFGHSKDNFPAPRSHPSEPTGVLTLDQVVVAVLLGNPDLQAFELEKRAVEARRIQAALRPNPELAFEFENVPGGTVANNAPIQATLAYGLPFELGGKRTARLRLAFAEWGLTLRDYEVKRIDVLTALRRAFYGVLGAQRQLELAQQSFTIASRASETVRLTVQAGEVSPVEADRTRIAQAEAAIELQRAQAQLAAARPVLAALWGSAEPRFSIVTGTLEIDPHIPPLQDLQIRIESNPDLARWKSELEQRRASLDLAKAQARPDVTPSIAYRRLDGTDENLFVLGVSLPLPARNRNQGAIREARLRVEKAFKEQEAAHARVWSALADAYKVLATSAAEARIYRDEILPRATRTFDAIREGYRAGKFRFLDLLDSQRTLAQVRLRHLQALVSFQQALADVERLTGESLHTVNPIPDTATFKSLK